MLSLYNTVHNTKKVFTSLQQGKVGMYTCGPTVYDYIHIGNLRAYVSADLLRRYLTYSGYEVRSIKNITDVGHMTDDDLAQGESGEDKMLKKARLEKKDPLEIARFYENAAKEDELEINILPVSFAPRATEHVPHMIAMIEKLIASGFAYVSNGNVFFDVAKMPKYGNLSGNTLEQLTIGARLSDPHPDKRHQWDFALWLKAPKDHLMQWDSPWSRGYPGWHIECSAMSTEYLGSTLDIHTGGEDNIFPHHEAEIAQSECATGVPFVRYWVHVRHLLVDGKKMSKSSGNFYTLTDIKKRGFAPADLRMLYLMSHYRSQMNFTWQSLAQAQKNRETINRFFMRLHTSSTDDMESKELNIKTYKIGFDTAMDDDLNTPKAIAVILNLITAGNAHLDAMPITNSTSVIVFLKKTIETVFGIPLDVNMTITLPTEIQVLVRARAQARTNKDFTKSDRLRDAITDNGFIIEDTPEGQKITKQ